MPKKGLFLMMVVLLVVVPASSLANLGVARAGDGPFAYPGPFGPYEKDIVTVACGQITPVFGDTKATIEKMKSMIDEAAGKGANIMVFPESTLGGCAYGDKGCKRGDLAENMPGPSSLEIAKLTEKYGMWVVYGFLEKDKADPSKLYNSAAIIGPKGIIGSFRKMFPTMIENVVRGKEPVAFDTPWGPVGVGICFDNYMFPELARTYALMGCRLLLTPAVITVGVGSPEVMINGLYARAVENFMFVACANRVGWCGYIDDAGQSLIVGPKKTNYGQVFYARASGDKEEVIIAKLDLTPSDQMRGLGCQFQDAPFQKEPLWVPEMWLKLWCPKDKTIVDIKELEATNKQLETMKQEGEALRLQSVKSQETITILAIVAAVLLAATIGLGVVALRKRKK